MFGVFILLLATISFATGTVTLKVEDETAVVSGATVKLMSNGVEQTSSNTDATGNVSFSSLPEGIYQVVVERDGYDHINKSVLVKDSETTSGNVFLRRRTYLALVADGRGLPVETATVTVTYPDQSVHTGTTSADGTCLFTAVPSGTLNVEVAKDGTQTVVRDVTPSDPDTDQLFTLSRWFINVTVTDGGTAVPGAALFLIEKASGDILNNGVTNSNGVATIVVPDDFVSGTVCDLRIEPHSHNYTLKNLGAVTASTAVQYNVSNSRSIVDIGSYAELNTFLTTGGGQIGRLTSDIQITAQITADKPDKTVLGNDYTITSSIAGFLTPAIQVDADYVRFSGVKFDAQNTRKNFIHVQASYCLIYNCTILNEAANGKGITSNNPFGATPHQLTIAYCTLAGSIGLVDFDNGQFRDNTQTVVSGVTESLVEMNNESLNYRIENNSLTNPDKTANGLVPRGAGAWVLNNTITGCQNGISVRPSLNSPKMIVNNNTITGASLGIGVQGDGGTVGTIVLSDNTITNFDNQGVQALNVVSVVAANNDISYAGSDGFVLTTPTIYVALNHNTIEHCSGKGVSLTGLTAGSPSLRANTVRLNSGNGIELSGTNTTFTLRKNVSASNGGKGLSVSTSGAGLTLDSTNDIVAANSTTGITVNNAVAGFKRSNSSDNSTTDGDLDIAGTSTVNAGESSFGVIKGNTDVNLIDRDSAYRQADNYSPEEIQGVTDTINQNSGNATVVIDQPVANADLVLFFGKSVEELANAIGGNQQQEIGIFWGIIVPTTDPVTIDLGAEEYSTQPLIVAGIKAKKPIKAVVTQPTVVDTVSRLGSERQPVVPRYAGPKETITIPWVITNDGNYTGNFNLRATATVVPSGQSANWGVKYVNHADGSEITAQVAGTGYETTISDTFQVDIQVTNKPGATDRIEITPIVTAGGNVESGMKATIYAAAVGIKKAVPMVSGNTLQLYVPGTQASGIQAAAAGTKTATLLIYDLSGKVIHRQDFTMETETTVVEKSLTSLGAGTYVYQIVVDGSVFDQGRFPVVR